MKLDAIKHNIKWDTWAGDKYRKLMTWLGLKMLRKGRKLIKRGMGRCSWCGANPGFSSTVSRKGLRCSSLNKNCTNMPDAYRHFLNGEPPPYRKTPKYLSPI